MYSAIELQRKLMEAQGIEPTKERKIKSYTASVRCQKDIENLSKILNTEEIAYTLDLPLSLVKRHQAIIKRQNEERRRFLRTGTLPRLDVPGMPTVYTIYQR